MKIQIRKFFRNLFYNWEPPIFISIFILALILIPIITWISCFLLVKEEALPNSAIFALIILEFGGLILGRILTFIKLPPLLGMLLIGGLIKNVPHFDFGNALTPNISSNLRQIALVVILIRAGLELDSGALMRLKGVLFKLSLLPCITEALTIALASHFIMDFPWLWGILLGFVVSGVSPAVVVPCLLTLRDQGYGIDQGIPTVLIAASSVDNIAAISLFGVVLGLTLAQNQNFTQLALQGPLEFILGILFGVFYGILTAILTSNTEQFGNGKNATFIRAFLIFTGGILSVFGFRFIKYPGAGALGCLVLTLVASLIWRERKITSNGDNLSWTFSFLWIIFQPLLFGLIGCEIKVNYLEGSTIGKGTICILIALLVREIVTYTSVSCSGFNLKEKIFISISWIPKATIQAAIGSVALDTVRQIGAGEKAEKLGLKTLEMAVLAILLTAPFGATAIMMAGPKLLKKSTKADKEIAIDSNLELQ